MLIFFSINENNPTLGLIFLGLSIGFLLIIPIFITISYHTYRKFRPYLGPSTEEINRFCMFLETDEVKKYIKYMFSKRNAHLHKICKGIEWNYDIELHHTKGPQWGQMYAEIIDKICEILGFADEALFSIFTVFVRM